MEGQIDNSSNTSQPAVPQTCEEYKSVITAGLHPYQLVSFIVPLNDTIWTERDEAWTICFIIYTAIMTTIFLMLGIASIVLLIKKDCVRLPTKTFFAVYMSIIVLGFSRALWLGLDTFGLLGFIGDQFPGWLIISRVFAIFGFPSLVASYTLMIFTLLKIAKAVPGKQWYHQWKYIIPIMLTPYIIAFLAQVISELVPYPGLLAIVVCELFFTVWGITVCIAFLSAGNRLLRELRHRERKTIRVSTTVNPNRENFAEEMAVRHEFASREHHRHTRRTRNTTRKITIITYGTAMFTILYSLITAGGVVMISVLLYHACLGYQGQRGNSTAWLVLETCKRINEIVLALVMLYSITDITGVVKLMCRSCLMKDKRVVQCNAHRSGLNDLHNKSSSQMSMLSGSNRPYDINTVGSLENITEAGELEEAVPRLILVDDALGESSTETVCHIGTGTNDLQSNEVTSPGQQQTPSQFLITAQGDSGISLDSGSVSPSPTPSKGTSHTRIPSTGSTDTPGRHPSEGQEQDTKGKATLCTVATQTVEITDSGCQTDTSTDIPVTKPIPKPRKFKPKLSRRRAANAQRLAALRQAPAQLTNPISRFKRKQTV